MFLRLAFIVSVILSLQVGMFQNLRNILGGAIGQGIQRLSNVLRPQVQAAAPQSIQRTVLPPAPQSRTVLPMSSQTNTRAANYRGSQTYAPQSRVGVSPVTAPFVGTTVTGQPSTVGQSLGQVLGQTTATTQQIDPNQVAEEGIERAAQDIASEFGNFLDRTGIDPFSFDEALARRLETEHLAPYYTETLQQFLRGVRSRASGAGRQAQNVLQELGAGTEFFQGRSKRLLESALENARQGFGERGLLFSGERGRAEGLLAQQQEQELRNFLQGQQGKEKSVREQQAQTLENLALEKEQTERSLARQQEEDVATGIERARQRAMTGAQQLESIGPAPGESYQDFLGRRANVFRSFTYGPSVS